jgi:hypothetical protein
VRAVELYGDLRGQVWNEGRIVLANGVCIQAFGRGQALRGVKHHDARPDLVFVDDVEEEEHVASPEARQQTLTWFMTEVIPALDKCARIRMSATPLDREALPMVLSRQADWVTRVYPIEYIDPQGVRRAIWPARYPPAWIDEKRAEFQALGLDHEYQREYMCKAEDLSKKIFTAGMFKIEPRVRVWQPAFAFYDPARTVKQTSATTGWAVWSWVGSKLIVWDGGAEFWQPDEIINHIFALNDEFSPVLIGVEQDGLHEFIMQPLRQERLRRGTIIPVEPYKAPKGKLQFIAGLQPFFSAGQIVFAKDIPAIKQFLSFPTGKIDFPNALAYALVMRPGQPIYEDFASQHVAAELLPRADSPVYLCLNATSGMTVAVAVQFLNKALHVLGDWVREGDPGTTVAEIIRDASLQLGKQPALRAGPEHFKAYDTIGLRSAVARLPAELRQGGDILRGREELRTLLRQQTRGLPALQVSTAARWTLNALAAGYAQAVTRRGGLAEEASDGVAKLLMEGLESFMATAQFAAVPDSNARYATATDGRRYLTCAPQLAIPHQPAKDRWWEDWPEKPLTTQPRSRPLRGR